MSPAPDDTMTKDDTIPIPNNLLEHDAIKAHPDVLALHEKHGGIPADADKVSLDKVVNFTNAIAHNGVDPAVMRRTDPSPRRAARVFRAEVLGHREPSVSPERHRSFSQSRPAQEPSISANPGENLAPAGCRSRYRSPSRPLTVKEEPERERREGRAPGTGAPGRRDEPFPEVPLGPDAARALENRLNAFTQQQHTVHERLMHAVTVLEDEYAQIQARYVGLAAARDTAESRNTNRVNYYLGEALVPVTNGRAPVPRHLPVSVSA